MDECAVYITEEGKQHVDSSVTVCLKWMDECAVATYQKIVIAKTDGIFLKYNPSTITTLKCL
jgi:hypothetical protein